MCLDRQTLTERAIAENFNPAILPVHQSFFRQDLRTDLAIR